MTGMGTPVAFENRPTSPAQAEAAIGHDVLERVLFDVQNTAVAMDRAMVTDALLHAIDALAALKRSHIDDDAHLTKFETTLTALHAVPVALAAQHRDELATMIKDVEAVEKALLSCKTRVVDASSIRATQWRDRLGQAQAPVANTPFRASTGMLALYRLARDPIVFPVRLLVPEEVLLDVDDSMPQDDDEDVVQSAPKPPPPPPPAPAPIDAPDTWGKAGEIAAMRRLAHELIEEIGVLGGLCTMKPARKWSRGVLDFELRLIAALDSLVVMGEPVMSVEGGQVELDVLGELLERTNMNESPDPGRAFARTIVLSCVAGEDRVRAAVVALQQAHPSTYPAHRDAFILGSNPAIGPAMQRLCADSPAPIVRLALDVLTARRECDIAVTIPLLDHPDPGVRIRAVRCLSVAKDRSAALSMLGQVIDEEPDTRISAAAMRGLVRLGEPFGLESARRVLLEAQRNAEMLHSDARLDLLELIGIAGNASDAPLLQRALEYRPREAEALGWHGSPAHVDLLLAKLIESSSIAGKALFCAGIARALERITGAKIEDASGNPWADPAPWRKFWEEHRPQYTQTMRYRLGRPYTPIVTLDELTMEGVLTYDRDLCIFELDAITSGSTDFDLRGVSAAVESGVARLRHQFGERPRHADGSTFAPGEWVSTKWLRRQMR